MPTDWQDTEFVKMVGDRVDEIIDSVTKLGKTHLLVGVPEGSNNRDGEKGSIGNAALAYIHNYGSERAHIPARPFMEPGVENSKDAIYSQFNKAAKAALDGNFDKSRNMLDACGMIVAENIKQVIVDGIPPPLKRATVSRRRKQRNTKSLRTAELKYEQLYRLMHLEGVPKDVAEQALFEGHFKSVRPGVFLGEDFVLAEEGDKGHRLATPLINTGQLLNSITHVIETDLV